MGMPIVGYADRLTATPGSEIRFMISSKASTYQARIVRLFNSDADPHGPGLHAEHVPSVIDSEYDGRIQPLKPGSFVRIPHREALDRGRSFTLHFWLWPTTPEKAEQTLVARGDPAAGGFAVQLGNGRISFRSSDAVVTVSMVVEARRWYSVTVIVDADLEEARIDVRSLETTLPKQGGARGSVPVPEPTGHDLLFAAEADPDSGEVQRHYNGKLDKPSLYSCALTDAEIAVVRSGSTGEQAPCPIGVWDFSADINSWSVTDTTKNELHGTAFNKPTRAVTGHDWDGSETNWCHLPEHYGAIHFHDDDLGDAGWAMSFRWLVPDDLSSGVYAAHVSNDLGADYIPFVVRPPRGTTTARAVFLMPTFTYVAYGNAQAPNPDEPLHEDGCSRAPQDAYVVQNRLLSLHDRHGDGSVVCYASRLRPIVNMRPNVPQPGRNGAPRTPNPFTADLNIIDWLRHFQYEVDVITDEDLHQEGEDLLRPYDVVITGRHSAYWSGEMVDAAQGYLRAGGRMIHLAGGGMHWITQLDPETGASIEVRNQSSSPRGSRAMPGEGHFSSTGELGGTWAERGRAPQTWLGVGFTTEVAGLGQPYRRMPDSHEPRAQFAFEGVRDDELIGDLPCSGDSYRAAGLGFDRIDPDLGTPSHALLLATTGGPDADAEARADMVLMEYPRGGAVFAPGAITWGGCLACNNYDNNISRITRNVLDAFLKEGLWPHREI